MHEDNFATKCTRLAAISVVLILALVPFHAFLTVWLAGVFGHYTALRLWSLALLVIAVVAVKLLFWRDKALRTELLRSRLTWLIVLYIAVQFVWGVVALLTHHVSRKALGYGWIINTRFVLFLLLTWVLATKTTFLKRHWQPLIFWPAAVVIIIGLLQYLVLPYDFLKHFGYASSTIYPFETINHNIHYIRIMSTLRGANPLGAYLVVVLSLLLAQLVRLKHNRLWYSLLGLAGMLTLIFSFSRSAWIGLLLSSLVVLISFYKTDHARRWLIGGSIVVLIAAGAGALVLRHNSTFQDAILHTDSHSKIAHTSNGDHLSALKTGLHDLSHNPLGDGPGSAGPASEYNNHPPRIAENYFVQVAQETGWIGLVIFVAINALLAKLLWQRRQDPLALGLFAALIGVTFINLLSHAWTDDTLAFIWWGLAGVALAKQAKSKHAA